MHYRVVFDVTRELPPIWFPAFGLVFILLGVLLWRQRKEGGPMWRGPLAASPAFRRVFGGFFLGFSVFWTVTSTIGVVGGHISARHRLSSGDTHLVEGPVEDFHPGGREERFTVAGVHFNYSDARITSGFNRTRAAGGPMREGLYVRIHYIGRSYNAKILKLEIRE